MLTVVMFYNYCILCCKVNLLFVVLLQNPDLGKGTWQGYLIKRPWKIDDMKQFNTRGPGDHFTKTKLWRKTHHKTNTFVK